MPSRDDLFRYELATSPTSPPARNPRPPPPRRKSVVRTARALPSKMTRIVLVSLALQLLGKLRSSRPCHMPVRHPTVRQLQGWISPSRSLLLHMPPDSLSMPGRCRPCCKPQTIKQLVESTSAKCQRMLYAPCVLYATVLRIHPSFFVLG